MSQELVDSVNELTRETTELLEAYVNSKIDLDANVKTAKDAAVGAADSERKCAGHELNAKGYAHTATSEALKAHASAEKAKEVSGLDTVEQAVQTALDDSYQYAMTEAEFEARREANRNKYAGSGFVEFGMHRSHSNPIYGDPVNNGLWVHSETPDEIQLGCTNAMSGYTGTSRTDYPIVCADGVEFELQQINSDNAAWVNKILLPYCPDGTQTYNSATGEYRDYKTYSDSRYPDEPVAATHNEAVCRAFEGSVIINGDFRHGDMGWTSYGSGVGTVTINEGGLSFEGDNTSASCYATSIPKYRTTENLKYKVTFFSDSEHPHGDLQIKFSGQWDGGSANAIKIGKNECIITAIETKDDVLQINPRKIGFKGRFYNFSVHPITEQVITSRQDLVFLESWLEKVSDKDIVVPLGNVQYGSTTWNGIALTKLTDLGVGQGYCAFGEWDTNTMGYGARWSALSDADKQKFLAEPSNNLYYSAEHGLCQWRYRVRSVAGYGNDWQQVISENSNVYGCLGYALNHLAVIPQEGQETPTGLAHINSGRFASDGAVKKGDVGRFTAMNKAGNIYKNNCMAISIALVQRLNSGAYHPMNPNGCDYFTDGKTTWTWYGFAEPVNTLKDCFTKAHGQFGQISGGGATGRPSSDPYAFYDAVYAGQVKDLRLSARKMNVNELRENAVRDAVSGVMRGWESPQCLIVKMTQARFLNGKTIVSRSESGGHRFLSDNGGFLVRNGLAYEINAYTNDFWVYLKKYNPTTGVAEHGDFTAELDLPEDNGHLNSGIELQWFNTLPISESAIKTNSIVSNVAAEQFDTLPHVDIIGSPENIAATMQNLGVDKLVGQWLPVIPDGTTRIPLNKKHMLTTSTTPLLFTSDTGGSWQSINYGYNSITNDLNSVAEGVVGFVCYPALANQTAPATNSAVVGSVGDVFCSMASSNSYGCRFGESLTGNINTDETVAANSRFNCNSKVVDFVLQDVGVLPSGSWAAHNSPIHTDVNLSAPTNNSPAVKTLTTITEKNGLLYLQCHGSELKYDTTAQNWGDNQKIPIVSGDSTQTDLNGHVVKTFCHHSIMPLGIAHNTNK